MFECYIHKCCKACGYRFIGILRTRHAQLRITVFFFLHMEGTTYLFPKTPTNKQNYLFILAFVVARSLNDFFFLLEEQEKSVPKLCQLLR